MLNFVLTLNFTEVLRQNLTYRALLPLKINTQHKIHDRSNAEGHEYQTVIARRSLSKCLLTGNQTVLP